MGVFTMTCEYCLEEEGNQFNSFLLLWTGLETVNIEIKSCYIKLKCNSIKLSTVVYF